jgi:hypothetical protein
MTSPVVWAAVGIATTQVVAVLELSPHCPHHVPAACSVRSSALHIQPFGAVTEKVTVTVVHGVAGCVKMPPLGPSVLADGVQLERVTAVVFLRMASAVELTATAVGTAAEPVAFATMVFAAWEARLVKGTVPTEAIV